MTSPIRRLRALSGSLVARVTLILAIGLAFTAILSLFVADSARKHDFAHARRERVVASTADIAERLARDPAGTRALLRGERIFGAREAPADWGGGTADPALDRMLAARLGPAAGASAGKMARDLCFPRFDFRIRAAGMNDATMPDCWYVRFRDAHGIERRLSIDLTPFRLPQNSTLLPLYLALIVFVSGALAWLIARLATRPLRRLSSAARAFSVSIDPEPIPEEGPREVRAALATFNIMQHRVREGFRERTHILASIAHDLQTPLTRLRLRLEQVPDEALRERLVADLAGMQATIRSGLDLARSSESREPWSIVDIDSILSSAAEDAAEFGQDVRFTGGCGAAARVKPNALARCLGNLVDNAVRYGGGAEIACRAGAGRLAIEVRDRGPGMTDDALARAFEPFYRNAASDEKRVGSGLGLTIARAQARTFNAELTLANAATGGLIATIVLAPA